MWCGGPSEWIVSPRLAFSQRIRLQWLAQTANLVRAGTPRQTVLEALQVLLHDQLSVGGHAERGNREKAITILMQIWVTVPPELACLRDAGLELLQQLPPDAHLAVHWGMTMAVYPFFGSVAGSVGRLLRLQGTAAAAQVQRGSKRSTANGIPSVVQLVACCVPLSTGVF